MNGKAAKTLRKLRCDTKKDKHWWRKLSQKERYEKRLVARFILHLGRF